MAEPTKLSREKSSKNPLGVVAGAVLNAPGAARDAVRDALPPSLQRQNTLLAVPVNGTVKVPIQVSVDMPKEMLPAPPELPALEDEIKPAKQFIDKVLLNLRTLAPFLACLLVAWLIGTMRLSVVWALLLGYAVWKVDLHRRANEWRVYFRDAERARRLRVTKNSDETLEWLNSMLSKALPIVSPAISAMAREKVSAAIAEQFKKTKPPQVKDVVVKRINVGKIPPEILMMRGYNEAKMFEDVVNAYSADKSQASVDPSSVYQLDVTVDYAGDFSLDLEVALTIMPVPVPVRVSDVQFNGKMRMQFFFVPFEPYVSEVIFAFKTAPRMKFKVESLVNVMALPSMEPMIQNAINDVMMGMLVLPNKLRINLIPKSEAQAAVESSRALLRATSLADRLADPTRKLIATLHVDLLSAKNLRAMDSNGLSDPFIKFRLGATKKKSETVQKSLNPVWNTAFEFPLFSNDPRELEVTVYDQDTLSQDDVIAEARYDFSALELEEVKEVHLPLGKQGNCGELLLKLSLYPEKGAKR